MSDAPQPPRTPTSAAPSPAALSLADVRKVADLARLELSDDAAQRLTSDLQGILRYVNQLRALDLTNVEPMSTPLELSCPLRDDTPGPTLPLTTFIALAPAHDGPFLRVPKVLADGGGA